MVREIRLALAQLCPVLGDLDGNLAMAERVTSEAAQAGARLVCFPELFLSGYHPGLLGKDLVRLAQPLTGEAVSRLGRAAARSRVSLIMGILERGEANDVLNSSVVINARGEVAGSYAKAHLFGSERDYFRPGNRFGVFQVDDVRVGVMICYDSGFPEVARLLGLQGAELIVVPAAWMDQDEDLWELNLRARAVDNLVFVAGVNRIGREGDMRFFGSSRVVGPRGRVLAAGKREIEEILYCDVDLSEVDRTRAEIHYWRDRRPELYGPLVSG